MNEQLDDVRKLLPQHVDADPVSTEIILPTGEIVNLADPAACARAIEDLRDFSYRIQEIKGALMDALVAESKRQGTKTLHLPDGSKVEIKGGERAVWDAQQLEADLRSAGMPEERIREIVVEEVSWTVAAAKANQAARANPDYARAVEAARSTIETRPTVAIKA